LILVWAHLNVGPPGLAPLRLEHLVLLRNVNQLLLVDEALLVNLDGLGEGRGYLPAALQPLVDLPRVNRGVRGSDGSTPYVKELSQLQK
jgi:hypothetical protein